MTAVDEADRAIALIHQDQQAAGAAALDQLHAALTTYVAFPAPEAADAVTLYIAATHAQPAWEHATRLVVKSPLKRCGKTRLLEVLRETVHRPLPTVNISAAALARSIGADDPPTLVIDEGDALFKQRKGELSESAETIRGLLNSGHSRGWPYTRWDATTRSLETVPTYAMAALAAIGDLPDTIEDRAVVVSMRRRAAGETVRQWRTRRTVPALRAIRDEVHGWVSALADELGDAEPTMPAGVEDRAADVWEPLLAVADAAGESWPDRGRRACLGLAGGPGSDESDSPGERLLADLAELWPEHEPRLPTATILDRLARLEESPWATWHRGDKLSPRGLAALLRPYGVHSRKYRPEGASETVRGYIRADLIDPWARYVHGPGTPPGTAGTAEQDDHPPSSRPVPDDVPASATAPGTGHPPSSVPLFDAGVPGVPGVPETRLDRATCPQRCREWIARGRCEHARGTP